MAIVTTQQTGKEVKVLRLASILTMAIAFIPMAGGNSTAATWFLIGAGANLLARFLHWWRYK